MPSVYSAGPVYRAFLQPGSLSLRVATWLIPSPSLRLCPNVTFSRKSPLTTILQLQKPRHPPSQPPGTPDAPYSEQLFIPKASVLLAYCMMDRFIMFIRCLSPPIECTLTGAGSLLTDISKYLAHGRHLINICRINEPTWALELNKLRFKSSVCDL